MSIAYAQSPALRVGAAKVDVTPAENALPQNYLGILDHIYSRAIVIDKQPVMFQERDVRLRRAEDSARWLMAYLSRPFDWRSALVVVKPALIDGIAEGSACSGAGNPDQLEIPRNSGI